jgi:hypothetical protein
MRVPTVISSIDKGVADWSRLQISGTPIWFSIFIAGFSIKGFGRITEATAEVLKFENAGVHSLVQWGIVKPVEIDYYSATEVEVTYLPAGSHPKAGWWRIVTEARAIISIGEMGEPPTMH